MTKLAREPEFFRWIRSIRVEMAQAMEGMTPAETTAYIRRCAQAARRERTRAVKGTAPKTRKSAKKH
jgi:hypothetical protein